MPAGVFKARSLRNSAGVKPKPDESLTLNSQPPENHQKSIMKHPVTLVILSAAKDLRSFSSTLRTNKPEMFESLAF
jgi:hypothetical protein